ncbi:hypothetical protein BGZ60DRAFT_438434 [Tricladium varicosporioides]|nr:hypothetical protein BGZ60DRAFT_438434 [Hymenoscyphus varicosporioides]
MSSTYHQPTVEEEIREDSESELQSIISFPTEAQLNRALGKFLPPLDDALGAKQIIRENVFAPIAGLLRLYGKGEWSLRPRTFAILRMLGCTELMDKFVRENWRDISLPYTESNLPDIIKGEVSRSRFLGLQKLEYAETVPQDLLWLSCDSDGLFT